MGTFEVLLGIDLAARDTGERRKIQLLATDSLSAAIMAENILDKTLDDPQVQYSHAMAVRRIGGPLEQTVAMAA